MPASIFFSFLTSVEIPPSWSQYETIITGLSLLSLGLDASLIYHLELLGTSSSSKPLSMLSMLSISWDSFLLVLFVVDIWLFLEVRRRDNLLETLLFVSLNLFLNESTVVSADTGFFWKKESKDKRRLLYRKVYTLEYILL